ncbi:hypothetical protein KR50_15030 [Jeotgalibacillus campisalis]|uniref:Uncharacterized protein n=1 Tax=Jeotgalibacillus campisalis TaxID=220754 RepID=A0A0C2RAJ3_9BACL|nr:hypothetical protein KR50_15030 [Jeotgalibacillus campisalis]
MTSFSSPPRLITIIVADFSGARAADTQSASFCQALVNMIE